MSIIPVRNAGLLPPVTGTTGVVVPVAPGVPSGVPVPDATVSVPTTVFVPVVGNSVTVGNEGPQAASSTATSSTSDIVFAFI
jgi:hypothetical protein